MCPISIFKTNKNKIIRKSTIYFIRQRNIYKQKKNTWVKNNIKKRK